MATDLDAGAPGHPRGRHRLAHVETLVFSALSLVASLVLSIDAVRLAADPEADLTCNINALISCGTVGLSWQAQVLGFPNAFLGLMFEPMVLTVTIAALGGTRFPRWFLAAVQGVYLIAFVFAWWLFTQSYFVIGALCPWCLTVTVATTLVFFSMLRVNILDNNLGLSRRAHAVASRWLRLGADQWLAILIVAGIAAAVIVRYV